MRQRIEKQQETKLSEAAVTVMFHDRRSVLGGNGSFPARELCDVPVRVGESDA